MKNNRKKIGLSTILAASLLFAEPSLYSVHAANETPKLPKANELNQQRILKQTPAIHEENQRVDQLLEDTPTSATEAIPKTDDESDGELNKPTNPQTPSEESDENKEVPQTKPPKETPLKAKHFYYKKIDEKKQNFYLKIKTVQKKNYPIYKHNPYNVDKNSMKPSHRSFNYKSKKMYISRSAKAGGKLWYRISYKGKLLGWIEANGLSEYYKNLNVKVINQLPELPTGCEITAVTMMLQYKGAKVNKMKMAREMPRTSTLNGNLGFVGSPYSKAGWWIFPPALMKLVKKYAGSSVNMTGKSFTSIKKQINRNHPVVVWVANVDGFVNHALTVTGYDNSRVYFNDPWTGKKSSMKISTFKKHWKDDKYRAISY